MRGTAAHLDNASVSEHHATPSHACGRVQPPPDPGRWSNRERGSALVMSMFMVVFVVGIVISGSSIIKSSRERTETAFLLTGQASQFARSGMTDAINWFRRQEKQPVQAFNPQLDTAASPQILDTREPDIGRVQEFRINGRLWGRYEVWKQWDADPDPTRLAWRQSMQVQDVSSERGRVATGSVWRIRCVGYVYDRRNPNRAYNERPNRVIATEVLEAEISRMSIMLPGQAALCSYKGSGVLVGKYGRVLGGAQGAGIYYLQNSGSPDTTAGTVTGVPSLAPSATYKDSIQSVFGINEDGLRSMADQYLQDETAFPVTVPAGTLTLLDAPSDVSLAKRPLVGSGAVVIRNNTTILPGTIFTGLLYVEGNLVIEGPARIQGAVVATGSVTIQGVGDFAEVIYDDMVIDRLQRTLANYRISRSARRLMRN